MENLIFVRKTAGDVLPFVRKNQPKPAQTAQSSGYDEAKEQADYPGIPKEERDRYFGRTPSIPIGHPMQYTPPSFNQNEKNYHESLGRFGPGMTPEEEDPRA